MHNAPSAPSAAPQARLLVVDDEQGHLTALADVLTRESHGVTCCANAAQALEQLRIARFDILLCDLMMPGMNGIELMQQALEIDADLVPVLMTGHGSIDSAVEAMKVGAVDYVLKPLRMAALRPVLQRGLEIHRLRVSNRLLQSSLEQHARRLEEANRDLDAFAGRIAHDLRGPIQVMVGFSQVVAERLQALADDDTRRLMARIVASGERADEMIRDLLRFARLGEGLLRNEPIALSDVVGKAIDALQDAAEGRAVQCGRSASCRRYAAMPPCCSRSS